MTDKRIKLAVFVILGVAGMSALSAILYELDAIGVAGERVVGSQYTPWDTKRVVEHSDVIVYGTVLSTEKIIKNEIGYHDETGSIEQVKKMPYQLLRIKTDEVIKGNAGDVIIVRDKLDAVVAENGEKIQVRYENSLAYEGGESGIFFIENIDGELVIDGYYSFLKDDGGSFKSGFLGADTPENIEEKIRQEFR